jgi:hypothetical protein
MWESVKASGFLSLLSHEVKTKLATAYFAIGSHNYESVRLRDVSILAATTTEKPKADVVIKLGDKTAKVPTPFTRAQLLHLALTIRLVDTEKGVKKLIDDLLKQDIWEESETEQTKGDKSQSRMPRKWLSLKRLTGWLKKGSNILSLMALIISSLLGGLALYHDLYPPAPPAIRAKLTMFIDYPQFMRATDSTVTDVTVNVKVVNDSPLTATIREWNLYLNYNMPYEILNKVARSGSLMLSPSTQTDFTITTTLEGQNHTVLPDTAIRNIVFTVSYQDDSGLQEATREYGFAQQLPQP